MKTFLFLLIVMLNNGFLMAAEVTITITSLPDNHPFDEDVYIAGDFNNWNPGDVNYKMTKNQNDTYSITLSGTGTIQFKFTRGSWAEVEKGENCEELSNRNFSYSQGNTYDAQVFNWADLCENAHTAAENVSVMSENFYIPQLNRYRRIWLYLPPDYDESEKNYPVLYMHDGQNLFDDYYSFAGEWGVDETLNSLFDGGDYGCIVVGIDNGGMDRIDEYTPWINPNYGGGDGELYAEFITGTLKPYIDSHYRTQSEREASGIMGSSLGGLISFYTGIEYQETFSRAGIFSPSFWYSDSCYSFAAQTPKTYSMKMYLLGGGQESGMIEDCNKMMDTLLNHGYGENELLMKAVPNGQHSEWFWKQEFAEAYQWLFADLNRVDISQGSQPRICPNPASSHLVVEMTDFQDSYSLYISDFLGKKVFSLENSNEPRQVISLEKLPEGIYFVTIKEAGKLFVKKIAVY